MEASAVAKVVTFLNKTSGRDKVYRTCQYGSRLVWWCVQETGRDPALVKKLQGLDSNLSTSRKLLRIGKSLEMLRAAQKSVHLSDPFLQFTITTANLNKACYLLVDHLLWMHRIGLVKVDTTYYGHVSSRFWLATLILSLARDLYGLVDIVQTLLRTDSQTSAASKETSTQYTNGGSFQESSSNGPRNGMRHGAAHGHSLVRVIVTLCRYQLALLLDMVKNLADLFLPLTYLGYIKMPPGFQGLCGVVSSIIGVLQVWDSKYKLVP